jgi:hypothetical protein
VWETTKSTVAKAALDQIAQFYAIEEKGQLLAAGSEDLALALIVARLLDLADFPGLNAHFPS